MAFDGITIEITSTELDKTLRALERAKDKRIGRVKEVIHVSAINVERKAKKFVPILTGRLESSIAEHGIRFENNKLTAIVETKVIYAAFVEFGTSKQRKQPYMFPAARLEEGNFIRSLAKVLK